MRNSWLCVAKYLNSWLNKNLNYSDTNKSFNPLIHLILFSPNKIPFCSYQSSSCGFWRWSRLHLSTTCLSPWRLFSYSNVTVDVSVHFYCFIPAETYRGEASLTTKEFISAILLFSFHFHTPELFILSSESIMFQTVMFLTDNNSDPLKFLLFEEDLEEKLLNSY